MTYLDNVRGGALDEHAATELKLYIDNTAELMGPRSQGESIRHNLLRKLKSGTFDLEKSIKLWMYLVESGAKMYAKEFDEPGRWHELFSVATRRAVARELAEEFYAQAKAGEFPEPGQLLGRLESNARRSKPKPGVGYAYEAEAVDASSEDWDTVVYTPTGREAFVGTRTIDGEMMNVWQVPAGVRAGRPYSHHIAQSPQMSRNASDPPPPPPRRRRVADPSLRRVRQIVEREERPFEPERRYPRATKPHHFVVNAGLEQWREPDDSSDFSAVWYGPGGRDEAEQATEIEDAPGGWYVREYQHLAGYVDDFDPDEPFLVTETFVDLGETLQALSDAGLTEPAYRVELMRYAVAFGVADLAERGGSESSASELP